MTSLYRFFHNMDRYLIITINKIVPPICYGGNYVVIVRKVCILHFSIFCTDCGPGFLLNSYSPGLLFRLQENRLRVSSSISIDEPSALLCNRFSFVMSMVFIRATISLPVHNSLETIWLAPLRIASFLYSSMS